jgi:hypothetical protein
MKDTHSGKEPNWSDIVRCPLWKQFTILICDNCETRVQCWGTNSELPEGELDNVLFRHGND